VFVPSFFMEGAARELFVPLSMTVGFAMISSYLLSSTFVPVLSTWLLRHASHEDSADTGRFSFSRVRSRYESLLGQLVRGRLAVIGLYLAVGQPESANRVLSRHPDQERILGTFAWARVFERWLSGKLDEAQAALFRAREVNPYAERYLSGKRPLPEEPPAYFRPGEDTDAQVCASNLAVACKSHPEFREWLRGQR